MQKRCQQQKSNSLDTCTPLGILPSPFCCPTGRLPSPRPGAHMAAAAPTGGRGLLLPPPRARPRCLRGAVRSAAAAAPPPGAGSPPPPAAPWPSRTLGASALRVSPLGLGLAALGRPGYINLSHGADLAGSVSEAALEVKRKGWGVGGPKK